MADKYIVLKPETWERLSALLDQGAPTAPSPRSAPPTPTQQTIPVRCGTLADPEADPQTFLYNGVPQLLKSSDLTTEDRADCFLYSWGDTLVEDQVYNAIRFGYHTLHTGPGGVALGGSGVGEPGSGGSGDTRPVFVCQIGSGGSEWRIIRTLSGPQGLQESPQPYTEAGFTCPPSPTIPPIFYLGTTMTFDGGCLFDDCSSGSVWTSDLDITSCNLCWLSPLYQPAYTGGLGTSFLNVGFPYTAMYQGQSLELLIDLRNAEGEDPTNIVSLNLPVYITALQPVAMRCDGTTAVTDVGPY